MNGPSQLPDSLRYVKNGAGGRWWKKAREKGQVHVGWNIVPKKLLVKPDFIAIKQIIKDYFGPKRGATQDFNALRTLLEVPSNHVWITFEDGSLWWCTVRDGALVNPNGESASEGNFWLACERPWSNLSLRGKQLTIANMPGTVTTVAGFQATVCRPRDWKAILRVIQGEEDSAVARSAAARKNYERAVQILLTRLSPKDFELFIDLILTRTGWVRISTLGRSREGIDIEAENTAIGEMAFVQVKSTANQKELDDYIARFKQRPEYARMIFAVHSPKGTLIAPKELPVQVWTANRTAKLAVSVGLGQWVENRVA